VEYREVKESLKGIEIPIPMSERECAARPRPVNGVTEKGHLKGGWPARLSSSRLTAASTTSTAIEAKY
jgi:hypothetical protein